MRLALLTPGPAYDHDWAWAYDRQVEALSRHGVEVIARPWTEYDGGEPVDLVMPLVAWGYNRTYDDWLAFLDRAEAQGWPMRNSPPLLRWNGDKAYLAELYDKGVPSLPTRRVAALDEAALAEAQREYGPDLVVKPPVSGGADGTYRLRQGDIIPADVRGRPMMIQPFMAEIEAGEYSLLLFGGKVSHCVLKTPQKGDYRVQPQWGGSSQQVEPPAGALELAREALAHAPDEALYARVDFIRLKDGGLALMELELIEPALFLHVAPDKGDLFAKAVLDAVQ